MTGKGDFSDIPVDVLDISQAIEQVGGEFNDLIEILWLYINHAPSLADEIREGLSANNSKQVHKAAHTLKGSSSNIFAGKIQRIAAQIEKNASKGDLEKVTEEIKALEREIDEFRIVYQKLNGEIREPDD